MRRLMVALSLVTLALLSLVPLAGATGERAGGALIDGSGNSIGSVELEQTAGGVRVTVKLDSANVVKPGLHGIHFHAVGKCEGPAFTSAGSHYNPAGKSHGLQSPGGPHAGDLPNLPIDASTATQGGYRWTATTDLIALSPGPATLFDADGAALVIHANPDDQVTDPTGISGDRVACAVITQQAPSLPNTGAGCATPSPWVPAALLGLATLALTGLVAGLARRRAA